MKIDWDYPIDNGDSVKEYLIEIKDSLGDYYSYLPTCDGSDTTIRTNRYCYVEMSVLRAAPFNLVKGDKIIARA